MTSSPPPEPPEEHGPPDQEPSYGGPPRYERPSAYGPPGYGPPAQDREYPDGPGGSAGPGISALSIAELAVAAGAVLYLIIGLLPWFDFGYFYLGVDTGAILDRSVSGFGSGLVITAFALFLLAALWALLPAVYPLRLGFPRAVVTVVLAALGLVLTLAAWFESLGGGFYVGALLGLLVAAGITAFAVLSLIPERRGGPAGSGRLAGAAAWANRPGPAFPGRVGGSPAPPVPPDDGGPGTAGGPPGAPGGDPQGPAGRP